MPVHDLEIWVACWREHLMGARQQMQELLSAVSRPGASPEVAAASTRAKHEYEQHSFLFAKSQEILLRKHAQAQAQVAQAHGQAQVQAQMTPGLGEPAQPGSRAADGRLPGATPFQPTPSPQPNADQQGQQSSPQFCQGGPQQTAIPGDHATFIHFLKLWFMHTGLNRDSIPKIRDKGLNLHQLYIEVEGLGGPEKVQATGLWHLVAIKMGYILPGVQAYFLLGANCWLEIRSGSS
ncbi:hypothetical protein BDV93DRAFT_560634 [Ceratobasidium sp. AG-I]|nr:hypothetical protein BDV93DRAFT_560634 [Ceratobasidium sp. AG-I]